MIHLASALALAAALTMSLTPVRPAQHPLIWTMMCGGGVQPVPLRDQDREPDRDRDCPGACHAACVRSLRGDGEDDVD